MSFLYRFCRFVCRCACTFYCRLRVNGRRHVPVLGGVLLVCNHQSYLDPILAGVAIPREASFLARDTLFTSPWFGRLLGKLNAYRVRRGEADISAIKETLRRLRDGWAVMIFPEGTRSQDGRIGRMMPGLAAIAKKAQVPIVPTLIDGVVQAWPRGQPLPWPADVIVEYGKPLLPSEYAEWSAERLTHELRERLMAMQHRWHSRVPLRRLKWWNAGQTGE